VEDFFFGDVFGREQGGAALALDVDFDPRRRARPGLRGRGGRFGGAVVCRKVIGEKRQPLIKGQWVVGGQDVLADRVDLDQFPAGAERLGGLRGPFPDLFLEVGGEGFAGGLAAAAQLDAADLSVAPGPLASSASRTRSSFLRGEVTPQSSR
jgi:hypothetical protein